MDWIIDTSAIIAVVANEPEKPVLVAKTSGVQLLAPASLPFEVGNAFAAMLKRKRIALAAAQAAIAAYSQIAVQLVEIDLPTAIGIADRLGLYAYDAYMLACAQDRQCGLITLDGGLVYAATQLGIPTLDLMP